MIFARNLTIFLSCLLGFTAATQGVAQTNKKKKDTTDRFVRIRVDENGKPAAMQTATVRFLGKNKKGEDVVVDLIGVVHIGEKEYYESLNQAFKQYDALLYELVAPKGTKIPKGGARSEGFNPVAGLQKGMKASLGLEFQLEHIDYTQSNFVHADMTPKEFGESMKNNNESIVKGFFKAMGQSIARSGSRKGNSDTKMLMALMANGKDRPMKLRQAMAEQMKDVESGLLIFEGDNGSTIVHHRNRKAFSVMQAELDSGKRRIGVFYGAGHLADMEERLIRDFKMRRAGTTWLDAWKLK